MSALTVQQLKDYVNSLPDEDMNCPCIMPMKTDMPHVFAFEEVCPGVTEMITIGASPEYMDDAREDKTKDMRALLIAPHYFHENLENPEHEHFKQN